MKHLKIFIDLTRLNKPIGFMLLFWPCSWGLAFAFYYDQNLNKFLYYLLLFFLGSVFMRSAGCIFNDVVDRDIDKKVQRTKNRPLPLGLISVRRSLIYVLSICSAAFLILIQFNYLTIFLGLISMFLAFAYPYMKRITYWPQLFLGLTFNWGIVMAWTAMNNSISIDIILLYLSAIFWTLGYDTIYGLQDIEDDEIIGMKSTSIKFKNKSKLFVSACYTLSALILIYLFNKFLGVNLTTFLIILYFTTLFSQVFIFNKIKSASCLKAFKINNWSGLILFLGILTLI